MVIRVLDHVESCDTSDQGDILKALILNEINVCDEAVVSFEGVRYVTSSFVNTAFLELSSEIGIEKLRKSLTITQSKPQINSTIRKRLFSGTA